jgi:hypothetical protein
MKPKISYFAAAAIFSVLLLSTRETPASDEALTRFSVELEAGPAWQSRNDVQIPNNENGTRFSLIDLVGKGPYPAARLYITWNMNERHLFRILLAPLTIRDSGILESPLKFSGEGFDTGVTTEATYKFNSWRATYCYRIYKNPRLIWRLGFTAKIRDAKIQLDQTGKSAKKTDVGFVPLLHVSVRVQLSGKWHLLLDIDALAGGPGRAEDAAIEACYDLNDHWSISGGYRMIEGGADVEEVYTFAWLHYSVLSLDYKF